MQFFSAPQKISNFGAHLLQEIDVALMCRLGMHWELVFSERNLCPHMITHENTCSHVYAHSSLPTWEQALGLGTLGL